VGTELFHTDVQTDMTKLIVAFRNFANAPKNDGQKPTDQKKKKFNSLDQCPFWQCNSRSSCHKFWISTEALPWSQQPATEAYPELDKASPRSDAEFILRYILMISSSINLSISNGVRH
jgi:hypothetical protein